ncbi:serine/threonine-protein kinase [Candidatus Uabimicrobium sp. HlEnr_7]|uniref:serine/threonine-protein kinase n=1 Tax=Candidatus Uabimicrobium helgolandensis TaxID=3095367 RepID=UPI0035561263
MNIIQDQSVINRYKILKEIGSGGMGRVYQAYDNKLEKQVAIKVLLAGKNATKEQKKRFLREVEAIYSLRHNNIISIYDIYSQPQLFFSMAYIDGSSLKDYQHQHSRKQMISILIKVAKAVHYMHENGVIHRDLKPSNILISKENEPIIMDFGLAKIMHSADNLTQTGDAMGTVKYASPEQIFGKPVDKTTDIYSLGVMLYEIVYKRPLFDAQSHENLLFAVLNEKPNFSKKSVAKELQMICQKALAKKTKERYQNAAQFARDLRNFQKKARVTNRPPQKSPALPITLVSLVLIVFLAIWFFQSPKNNIEQTHKQSKTQKNSVEKQAQKHFASHKEHFANYQKHFANDEFQKAWEELKLAISDSPKPAYHVHAWILNSQLVRDAWLEPIRTRKMQLINKQFLHQENLETVLEKSDDILDIYALAILKIQKNQLNDSLLLLEKCWKKARYLPAAERLFSLYYRQKYPFEKIEKLFNSIENKTANLYINYIHISKKYNRNNQHMYSIAAELGNINAKCSIGDFSATHFARALRGKCQELLKTHSKDAAFWLQRLQEKQQELLAYNFYELEDFAKIKNVKKAKAQHHFQNYLLLLDCFYIDLAWHEIKKAIEFEPDNFVYYVCASEILMIIANQIYHKPQDKGLVRPLKRKITTQTLEITKSLPKNNKHTHAKYARALLALYAQKKAHAANLFENCYREGIKEAGRYSVNISKNSKIRNAYIDKNFHSNNPSALMMLSLGRVTRNPKYDQKAASLGNINALCTIYANSQTSLRQWLFIAVFDFYRIFSALRDVALRTGRPQDANYWYEHMQRKEKQWLGYTMDSLRQK